MHITTGFIALTLLYGQTLNEIRAEDEINEASYDEYSFIVSIGRKGNRQMRFTYRQGHFCGGALITREHVLTAAHCLIGERPINLQVIVGMTNFSKASVTYNVKKWKTYNNWANKLDSDSDHDIAVIKLTECVSENYVQTIQIFPNYLDKNEVELETAGWGKSEQYVTCPVLQKIHLKLIPLKTCENDLLTETNNIHSIGLQHMCTRSSRQMHLTCGQSGGPLILREDGVAYVVGVNEAYCGQSTTYINTHSRVSYYKKFIREATNCRTSCMFTDNR